MCKYLWNIVHIEVFGKRLSGYSLVHASFLYMEATKKYYIEAAAIIARLQLSFLLYILHTQDISTITAPWCRLEEVSTRPNPTWNFLFIKVSQQGFDLILLSRVIYYCNYIFCNIVKHFTLINKNHQRKHFSITSQLTQYDHCSIAHMSNIVQLWSIKGLANLIWSCISLSWLQKRSKLLVTTGL